MRKVLLLGFIIFLVFLNLLFANDKYITYTQTFPWIGPDGENPEVVFADLIEQERLIEVNYHDFHVFWYDGCTWQNEIGKIRNDCLYKIKVLRDVPDNYKERIVKKPPNRDPTTIIVDINGTGDYTSIQEGIDSSVNGDTVLVYSGTYYENINYNGKNITVASLYLTTQADSFIYQTIIDGNHNGSVVTFESGEDTTAVLCGFTIKNGSGTYYHTVILGGGIFIKNSESKINRCIIKNNQAGIGGGIAIDNGKTILENATICDNHAYISGGGINLFESFIKFSSNQHCNMYNNYAGRGCDINIFETPDIDVIVDTFTVLEPNSHFAYNRGSGNLTFNILHSKITPINQDLYVSPDGNNNNSGLTPYEALKTIAYALNLIVSDSLNSNTIHLASGIYSPSLTGEKFALNCKEYISIIGENEETTIFDGEELSNFIIAYTDNNFSIENVTLQNGRARFGGAMCIGTNSSPIIKNIIIKNYFAYMGSSIFCSDNCNPIFDNVTVRGNPSILLDDEPISIYENSNPVFINCTIENNRINPEESGVGAISCVGHSNPVLLNTNIIKNDYYYTSAIALYNGSQDGSPILINCTICDNSDCSHGIINQLAHANLTLVNCILRNYADDEIFFSTSGDPDTVTISYTNIKDSISGINTNNNGTIIWGDGNIDEDPLFVGGDPFSYELTKYSPCIDAGTPDTTGLNLPSTDLAGNQRIYNGRIDIGAYEYQGYGIDEPDTSFIHNLYLFNNTPNPFKESTTISFISADYERIKEYTLSIYNTKGQLVRRYEGKKDNFWVKTEIVWDGTDEQGRQVAPGTYLYKLEYNGNAVVRKMVKVK